MRIARETALRLRPFHDRQSPRWPAFDLRPFGARISLIFQIEQAHVPECFRAEATDFEIVFHYGQRLAETVYARIEKLSLIVETRSPRKHAPDIQPFAFDLLEHIFRRHAFGRTR